MLLLHWKTSNNTVKEVQVPLQVFTYSMAYSSQAPPHSLAQGAHRLLLLTLAASHMNSPACSSAAIPAFLLLYQKVRGTQVSTYPQAAEVLAQDTTSCLAGHSSPKLFTTY